MTSTDSNKCVLLCEVCGQPVTGDGYLAVNENAATRRIEAYSEWRQQHGVAVSFSDMITAPARERWAIYHEKCDPQPEADGYAIPANECRTYDELLGWTTHLMEKNWLDHTDWAATVRKILRDSGSKARVI